MTLLKSHPKIDETKKRTTQTSPANYNWHTHNIGTINFKVTATLKKKICCLFLIKWHKSGSSVTKPDSIFLFVGISHCRQQVSQTQGGL